MFKSPRYLTRGVSANIPSPLQIFIWNCIELLPEECDYLQVFELKPFGGTQQIEHTAEQPEHHKICLIPSDNPITAKIYVIDDTDHTTMLLAEEY